MIGAYDLLSGNIHSIEDVREASRQEVESIMAARIRVFFKVRRGFLSRLMRPICYKMLPRSKARRMFSIAGAVLRI